MSGSAKISSTENSQRPRPALFRALGGRDLPEQVQVDGATYCRVKEFKHDSWAATALYENGNNERIVCKFNRTQSVFGFPLIGVGWLLARRENKMFARLRDVANVPAGCGGVILHGKRLSNVSAHQFIEGETLRIGTSVGDSFFDELDCVLRQLHRRNIAYVDLHKCENVIVGKDGKPYLIDFQISLYLPPIWPLTAIMRVFQQCDLYHVAKMKLRVRAGTLNVGWKELEEIRPWWIRIHRIIGVPFRQVRRKLFVLLGIRSKEGAASSEQNPEEGLRTISSMKKAA
ncbi:hypothetical protein N9242_03295 [Vicingaceae bacterium]|nr:hypothetical protein [Vicingaceae bacterium]